MAKTMSDPKLVRSMLAESPEEVDAFMECIRASYGDVVTVIEQQLRLGTATRVAVEFDTLIDIPQIKKSLMSTRCSTLLSRTLTDRPITANPYL